MPSPAASDSSRSRLMAAALEVFNDVGVNTASIHVICKQAGVSIGSAYHHFGSKQAIADALLAEGLSDHLDHLEARLGRVSGAAKGLHVIVQTLIEWIERNPEWARFIYTMSDSGSREDAQALMADVSARYGKLIAGYFQPYFADDTLRRVPPECFGSLVVGPVHDYARKVLGGQARVSLSRQVNFFADAAWRVMRNA